MSKFSAAEAKYLDVIRKWMAEGAESAQLAKGDVRSVIEHMATVGYKELNEAGEFVFLAL